MKLFLINFTMCVGIFLGGDLQVICMRMGRRDDYTNDYHNDCLFGPRIAVVRLISSS